MRGEPGQTERNGEDLNKRLEDEENFQDSEDEEVIKRHQAEQEAIQNKVNRYLPLSLVFMQFLFPIYICFFCDIHILNWILFIYDFIFIFITDFGFGLQKIAEWEIREKERAKIYQREHDEDKIAREKMASRIAFLLEFDDDVVKAAGGELRYTNRYMHFLDIVLVILLSFKKRKPIFIVIKILEIFFSPSLSLWFSFFFFLFFFS